MAEDTTNAGAPGSPTADGADGQNKLSKAAGDIAERWGNMPALRDSLKREGFLGVPAVFLTSISKMGEYGITPTEALFILQVMSFKWGNSAPFPSYKKLAARIGVSEAYIKKLAKSLEDKKILKRVKRIGYSNEFDFSPLFKLLEKEALEAAERAKENASRRSSKG